MSEVKDNHYVPRLYLRNFTDNPAHKNGKFDFLNLESQEHIGVIPHGSQMKERYFYKKGTDIEKKLGDVFEGKHATIVKNILDNQFVPDSASLIEIVLLMHFRTRAQRDEDLFFRKHMIDQNIDVLVSSFKSSLKRDVPFLANAMGDAVIEDMVRGGSYKKYLKKTDSAEKQIKNFERIKEEMAGLKSVILNNTSSTNLISSDRPVLLLNPFLNRKKVNFGKDGMFQMGILLVLPISPTKIIICFDSNIYENPFEISKRELSDQDVEKINKLQILCGVEGIYSKQLPKDITEIVSAYLKEKKTPQLITVHLPDDYYLTYKESNLPNFSFDFLKEKKEADTLRLRLPYPRPDSV